MKEAVVHAQLGRVLGAIAAGFAIANIAHLGHPAWSRFWIGLLLAAALFALATIFRRVIAKRGDPHTPEPE
jgi:hypothetical protein